jgi:nucleoside-diphosphate-sugar epimerase
VGTELCFLFRKDGLNVVPIVRNRIGAIFLDYHGFNCRIAEIANENDAKNTLSDIDIVVVATLAFDSGGPTRRSRRINDAVMQNSIRFCMDHAKIVFLSSIRAFSGKVHEHTSRFQLSPPYDVEKRHGEKILFRTCENEGKVGHALRLGHVFGRNQPRTRNIVDLLSARAEIHFQVSADRPSNALHTPTLKEAIMICAVSDLKGGTYSVVNSPQWTWRDVFDHYRRSTEVVFHGDPEKRNLYFIKLSRAMDAVFRFMRTQSVRQTLFGSEGERRFSPLRLYLPTCLEQYLRCKYIRARASSEVKELEEVSAPIYLGEFGYRPIPGPFIPGLSETKILLDDQDGSKSIFDYTSKLPTP